MFAVSMFYCYTICSFYIRTKYNSNIPISPLRFILITHQHHLISKKISFTFTRFFYKMGSDRLCTDIHQWSDTLGQINQAIKSPVNTPASYKLLLTSKQLSAILLP